MADASGGDAKKGWKPATKAVRGGLMRSEHGEIAEALYLTSGYAYDSAEQAEARFLETGPDEFIYARYGNPTVAMFEERIALLEGAEDAFATASGMAAVNGALTSRVGVATMEVCRPLPFLRVRRPSVSGLVKRALVGLFPTR